MADSTITKKTLANALKRLMCDLPFSKISISDICDLCDMNRKSFYYHFRDKYDLVNWIFDTEFVNHAESIKDTQTVLKMLCGYLYSNREYYKRAFKIDGQNSLRSHFCELTRRYISHSIHADCDENTGNDLQSLQVRFYSDGFVCGIERWVIEEDCASPERFCTLLCSLYELHCNKTL